MTKSSRIRVSTISLAIAGLVLLSPQIADATIYCVADPTCPQGSVAEATPEEAIEAADLNIAPDTVRIGPGEFTSGELGANTEIDIVGAGREATRIVADQTVNTDLLSVFAAGSSVSNLELRLSKSNTNGLRLSNGTDASDLSVRAASSLTSMTGVLVEDAGTEATRLDIRLGPDLSSHAFLPTDGGTIEDSFLQAGLGIGGGDTPTVAKRLHIRAAIALRPFGGVLTIRDSLVEPHPESSFFNGTDVNSSNGGPETAGILVGVNLTIVGNGQPGSIGVLVDGNTGDAAVNLLSSIVANVSTSLLRSEQGGDDVDITLRYSSYDDSTKQLAGAGTGSTTLQNNLAGAPDSGFVNGGASDYRLRPDSVLVDAGSPVPPTSDTDFRGLARVRDGNADGSSLVDVGAFEYQRVPPTPAFAFSPGAPLFGDAVSFDGAATSDVDGDPLSLSWSLGDGASAGGAQASRLYALPGTYQATLTATDVTGLSASVTHPVTVALRSGRCANRRSGSKGADTVKGFTVGDLLDGLGGNDVLSGEAGDDCLFGRAGKDRLSGGDGADEADGGPGNDRLSGGAGNDRLKGAGGKDRLKGGAGRDRVDGGAGNDVLDLRGGGRDVANCGAGRRDRALADKRDKLRRCERVRRRR